MSRDPHDSLQSTQTELAARDARPRRLWDYEELDVRLVYVAPLPLTGLEGLHHRVSSFFEVLGGMPAGRGVATADMSADETLAQL